jgi:hypothetical protein
MSLSKYKLCKKIDNKILFYNTKSHKWQAKEIYFEEYTNKKACHIALNIYDKEQVAMALYNKGEDSPCYNFIDKRKENDFIKRLVKLRIK